MALYIFLSIVAGTATVLSGVLNSALGKEIGMLQGVLINFIAGLIPSLMYLLYIKIFVAPINVDYSQIPMYLYLGSVFGFLGCFLSNNVYPKVSALLVTLLIFIGQMFTGALIDKFFFGFDISATKILGILFIGLGILINMLIDKKIEKEQNVNA